MNDLRRKLAAVAKENPEFGKALARELTAGWWGDVPLDGDAPLDLLHAVENKDPKKGAAEVLKELKSREFADRYAAMGVWDAVMTTKAEPYYTLFSKLTPAVIRAAKKGVPEDDDWAYSQTVAKYLKSYAQGKPTHRPGRTKFKPKTKDAWYIDSMYVAGMSGVADLDVTMRNRWTGETKEIEETISDGDDWDRVRGENYGGKNDRRQQSILLTFERDDKTGQVQIEVDPATGEFREDSFDDWDYMENW